MRAWMLCLSVGVLAASVGNAQGGPCPDVKATNVDVRYEKLGSKTRCGVGIKLFGLRAGLFGPRCPEKKVTYPAHGECKGEVNKGTRCKKQSDRPVTVESCECDDLGVLGTGVTLPSCSCTPMPDSSTIEHFVTEDCLMSLPFPKPTEPLPGGYPWSKHPLAR